MADPSVARVGCLEGGRVYTRRPFKLAQQAKRGGAKLQRRSHTAASQRWANPIFMCSSVGQRILELYCTAQQELRWASYVFMGFSTISSDPANRMCHFLGGLKQAWLLVVPTTLHPKECGHLQASLLHPTCILTHTPQWALFCLKTL